jgi:two-component system sensor kinase
VHEATVRLGVHADTLVADIEDRGVGFPSESILAAGQTRGLAGMRERARLLGGRLTVKSVSRRGTSVHAELPLHPDARRSLRQID